MLEISLVVVVVVVIIIILFYFCMNILFIMLNLVSK